MFFNFAPTKDMDWKLEPGNTYVLRYRMLVFDGEITAEQAEQTWQAFAHPPKVSVNMRQPKFSGKFLDCRAMPPAETVSSLRYSGSDQTAWTLPFPRSGWVAPD